MAVMQFSRNMGIVDRIVRGVMGSVLLFNGIANWKSSPARKVEVGIGGLSIVYAITGFDPLLKAFGASTIAGASNSIMKQMKQAVPGQGINPMLTQQPIAKRVTRSMGKVGKNVAEALSIR